MHRRGRTGVAGRTECWQRRLGHVLSSRARGGVRQMCFTLRGRAHRSRQSAVVARTAMSVGVVRSMPCRVGRASGSDRNAARVVTGATRRRSFAEGADGHLGHVGEGCYVHGPLGRFRVGFWRMRCHGRDRGAEADGRSRVERTAISAMLVTVVSSRPRRANRGSPADSSRRDRSRLGEDPDAFVWKRFIDRGLCAEPALRASRCGRPCKRASARAMTGRVGREWPYDTSATSVAPEAPRTRRCGAVRRGPAGGMS